MGRSDNHPVLAESGPAHLPATKPLLRKAAERKRANCRALAWQSRKRVGNGAADMHRFEVSPPAFGIEPVPVWLARQWSDSRVHCGPREAARIEIILESDGVSTAHRAALSSLRS